MYQAASALQSLLDAATVQRDSAALQYVDRTAAAFQVRPPETSLLQNHHVAGLAHGDEATREA